MADTSFFDKFFSVDNNPAIQSLKGLPSDALDYLSGLDADTLEYLESLERDNTIPLTMKDQIGQRFRNILPDFVNLGLDTGENIKTSIDEFLSGDSSIVAGLKDGTISEGDVNLDGVDLVQVLGDNLQTNMFPEELINVGPNQRPVLDPSGEGRIKARPTTMGEFEITGRNLEPYNPVGGLQTINPELQSEAFGDLEFELEKEKQRKIDAENFRKQEEKLTQGGLNSMTIAESDKINADSKKLTQGQQEDVFMAAMDDFLGSALGTSPDKKERTLADYKKEFADATGIDVSGKVDNRLALMAGGLSLLQNRAGKDFNVSKMLKSVGEAGEKALPALEKAKAEAKKAGLAAGKYALETRNSDMAKDEVNAEKARQRSAFYIVPKGKGVSGFLANIDQGQLENLNPFELDALMSNKSFQEKFDVVPGSTWSGIVEEAMKTPEAKSLYLTKNPNMISLIPGVENDLFTIKTFSADPNVEGNEGRSARLDGDGQETYKALAAAAQDLERAKAKFMEGFGLAESTSAFRFTLDKVDSLAGAFGINVDGQTNSTEKLKLFLTKLQAQNAKEILGEAGKTISDADRLLVQSIVGNVGVLTNPDVLAEKMSQLYNDIILKKEREIFAALETLDRYSGRKIASRLGGGGELNSEEQAELDAAIAAIGE